MESTLFVGRHKKAAVSVDNDQIIQISVDLGKLFPAAGVNKSASEDRRKSGDSFCGCSLKSGTWVWAALWMAECCLRLVSNLWLSLDSMLTSPTGATTPMTVLLLLKTVLGGLGLVLCSLLMHGLRTDKPELIAPSLVYIPIAVIFSLIVNSLLLIIFHKGFYKSYSYNRTTDVIALVISVLVEFITSIIMWLHFYVTRFSLQGKSPLQQELKDKLSLVSTQLRRIVDVTVAYLLYVAVLYLYCFLVNKFPFTTSK